MQLPTIEQTIYVLAAVLVAAVVIVVWFVTKEKRELALPNETDYGIYWIPLPTGLERGRLTSARKTFERSLETAIANAGTEKEAELHKLFENKNLLSIRNTSLSTTSFR